MPQDIKQERDDLLQSLPENWKEKRANLYYNYASLVAKGEKLQDPLTGRRFHPDPEATEMWESSEGKPPNEWFKKRDKWADEWIAHSDGFIEYVDTPERLDDLKDFIRLLDSHQTRHIP